jgi:hypothetical protein
MARTRFLLGVGCRCWHDSPVMHRWTIPVSLALILAAVAVWWGADRYRAWRDARADREVESFLANHWSDPLAAQGEPPVGFSPVEASLAPESCGGCHAGQYADWRTSLHAHTIGPGILWQFHLMEQSEANRCLRCHAPLAEQKALMARERGWQNAPQATPPPYVPADLHRQGLVCAACHVRAHVRYGPPRQGPVAPADAPQHSGFVASPAFEDSRFCATCHQFAPDGRRVNGKLLEDTYEEWRASPAAAAAQTCQSCHMPGRRHLWRGIHDAGTVDRSLQRELAVTRLDAATARASARLRSRDVGHFFPTYAVPKLYVTLRLQCTGCGDRELARRVIGRELDVDLTRELADTRLAPGGEMTLSADFAIPAAGDARVALRVEVAPGEHYERMFQHWLERRPRLEPVAEARLRQAVQQVRATRYQLTPLTASLPAAAGETRRGFAN